MKHIKRDHTEAFCKTANGKFIIALHKDGIRNFIPTELQRTDLK